MDKRFRIILQPEAYAGLESGYSYIEQDDPERAHYWAAGLMEAIASLDSFPGRCGLAPENNYFTQEIRHLIYGRGRNAYRVLFTIVGDAVSVLNIRHGARDTLRPPE